MEHSYEPGKKSAKKVETSSKKATYFISKSTTSSLVNYQSPHHSVR